MENRTNFVQLDQTGKKYLPHIWYGQKDTPQEGAGGVPLVWGWAGLNGLVSEEIFHKRPFHLSPTLSGAAVAAAA